MQYRDDELSSYYAEGSIPADAITAIVDHDEQCERNEHARLTENLPHASAEDAGDSFWKAVALGWIDDDGNPLCGCVQRLRQRFRAET